MNIDLIKKNVYKLFTAFLYVFVVGHLLTACSDNDSSSSVALTVSTDQLNVSSTLNSGIISRTINLGTSNGSAVAYSASSSTAWLSSVGATVNAPTSVDINIDTDQLAIGDYVGIVTFTAAGYSSVTTTVNVTITENVLTVSSGTINVSSELNNGIVTRTVDLDTTDSLVAAYTANSDAAWLSAVGASGNTPETVDLQITPGEIWEDSRATYIKAFPRDPLFNPKPDNYYYRYVLDGDDTLKYHLGACLEDENDPDGIALVDIFADDCPSASWYYKSEP